MNWQVSLCQCWNGYWMIHCNGLVKLVYVSTSLYQSLCKAVVLPPISSNVSLLLCAEITTTTTSPTSPSSNSTATAIGRSGAAIVRRRVTTIAASATWGAAPTTVTAACSRCWLRRRRGAGGKWFRLGMLRRVAAQAPPTPSPSPSHNTHLSLQYTAMGTLRVEGVQSITSSQNFKPIGFS